MRRHSIECRKTDTGNEVNNIECLVYLNHPKVYCNFEKVSRRQTDGHQHITSVYNLF
jgi:hypothetical protein